MNMLMILAESLTKITGALILIYFIFQMLFGAFASPEYVQLPRFHSQFRCPSRYLTFIIKFSTSAPVEEAVNAVSWAHQIVCTDDSTQSEMVNQVLVGTVCQLTR